MKIRDFFLINDKLVFFVSPPYEKDKIVEKCQAFNFEVCSTFLMIYILYLAQIMRALLSNSCCDCGCPSAICLVIPPSGKTRK